VSELAEERSALFLLLFQDLLHRHVFTSSKKEGFSGVQIIDSSTGLATAQWSHNHDDSVGGTSRSSAALARPRPPIKRSF
jgi:hypothetical protein